MLEVIINNFTSLKSVLFKVHSLYVKMASLMLL